MLFQHPAAEGLRHGRLLLLTRGAVDTLGVWLWGRTEPWGASIQSQEVPTPAG